MWQGGVIAVLPGEYKAAVDNAILDGRNELMGIHRRIIGTDEGGA